MFRLVENARDHQRRPVVIEQIADWIMDSAFGVHRDLPLKHQPPIDAPRAPAVQRLIQHRRGVPIGSQPARRRKSDGHGRQRSELFFDHAATLRDLRRLAHVGLRRGRPRGNRAEVALGEFESFLRLHVAKH